MNIIKSIIVYVPLSIYIDTVLSIHDTYSRPIGPPLGGQDRYCSRQSCQSHPVTCCLIFSQPVEAVGYLYQKGTKPEIMLLIQEWRLALRFWAFLLVGIWSISVVDQQREYGSGVTELCRKRLSLSIASVVMV